MGGMGMSGSNAPRGAGGRGGGGLGAIFTETLNFQPMIMNGAISIKDIVRRREELRDRKDFEAADLIRDFLRQFGVYMCDRDRSWNAADGSSGSYRDGLNLH